MQISWPQGLGAIIAIIVLVLAVMFVAIGKLPLFIGLFIIGLAAARLC